MGQKYNFSKLVVERAQRRLHNNAGRAHWGSCASPVKGPLDTRESSTGWQKLTSYLPHEKYCYGWLHRRLLRRYRPQSAVNCSTLWEQTAGSSPNTSQVSLVCIGFYNYSCSITQWASEFARFVFGESIQAGLSSNMSSSLQPRLRKKSWRPGLVASSWILCGSQLSNVNSGKH